MRNYGWRGLLRNQGSAILMILCGGILAVCPDSVSVFASAVLGWIVIALGVMLVIAGVIGGVQIMTIIQGAGLLVAGSWLHRHPLMLAAVLGTVLGLVALSQGLRKGIRALRTRRYGGFWVWNAGFAALELLIGLVLIVLPLSLSRVVAAFAGIFMVICGAADLFSGWKSGYDPDGDGRIIDADK